MKIRDKYEIKVFLMDRNKLLATIESNDILIYLLVRNKTNPLKVVYNFIMMDDYCKCVFVLSEEKICNRY